MVTFTTLVTKAANMALLSLFQYLFLLLTVGALYLVFLFGKLIWRLQKIREAVDQFPMDSKHWFWGHLNRLSSPGEDGLAYYRHMVEHYPKACGLYLGNFIRPYVVVHHPETVKAVLTTIGKKPVLFGIYKYGVDWLGDGLIMSHGQKWFRNRRMLTLPFYFDNLKYYIGINNEATDLFLNNLSAYASSGDTFEIYRLSSMLTLDIILRCMFSYKSGVQEQGEDNFYLKSVEKITNLWVKRYYEPLKHYDFVYRFTRDGREFKKCLGAVNGLSEKLIEERKLAIAKGVADEKTKHDFLDLLVKSRDEDGVGLTNQEIKDEVNTFIFGGHDTTASTIAWTLYSLAGNPECQKHCQEEIDQLFSDKEDDNFTWNDLYKLPYLTMCVREGIRLHGIVPFIERELDQDLVIDGKKVPSGTSIMLLLYSLHHNPAIWKDPMKFDPERFSEANMKKMDPFAYRPFSAGPRSCIAQNFALDEIKLVLAKVLKRFSFTLHENHVPAKIMVIAMRSTNGVLLKVSER